MNVVAANEYKSINALLPFVGMFLNYLWGWYQQRPRLGKYSIDANSNWRTTTDKVISSHMEKNIYHLATNILNSVSLWQFAGPPV